MKGAALNPGNVDDDWQAAAPPRVPPEPKETVALAIDLLTKIAEDPMLRSVYRVAARRHLRMLTA